VALLAMVVLSVASCGDGSDASGERSRGDAVGVVAHEIAFQPRVLRVESVGTSRARATATLYPETGGEVVEILYEAGDLVVEGTPLLRLESREELLAVRQANVELRNAEQLLARYRRIEDTGAISESQIDEGQTAVDAANIALDQARNALVERTILAPFTGHIGLSDIDVGARITTATVIAQLDDRSTLYVDFDAPEEIFGQLSVGDTVSVTPFSTAMEDAEAKRSAQVIAVDSRIDPTTRTLVVRTAINNEDDALRPGMSFEVVFTHDGREFAAIPEVAILWGSDGAYVWALDDGTARRTPVQIVSREEGIVLVQSELAAGDKVIVEGIQKVRDGDAVEIVRIDDSVGGNDSDMPMLIGEAQ